MNGQALQMINLSVPELTELISQCIKAELQKMTSLASEKQKEKENELLTRKEVCDLLNVSTTTLFHWNNDNTLPAQKIGSRVYYQKSQIMDKLNKVL